MGYNSTHMSAINKEQSERAHLSTRREALRYIFSTLTVVPFVPSLVLPSTRPSLKPSSDNGKKLPEDIVPKEELAGRGMTIWNLEDVKLHLRRRAIVEESLAGLDIVLVDGAAVKSYYLTEEQQAAMPAVVSLLEPQEQASRTARSNYYLNNRDLKRKEYEERLARLEQNISQRRWDAHVATVERQALRERFRPFLYEPTLEDLNRGGSQTMIIESEGRRRALIAMRDPDAVTFFSGTVSIREADDRISRALAESQSFPSADYFRNSFERKNIVAMAPGLALRRLLAELSQPTNPENIVVSRLAAAEQAYIQNQDDSLYYFAFETPLFVVTT